MRPKGGGLQPGRLQVLGILSEIGCYEQRLNTPRSAMFFRNLAFYRITQPLTISPEQLSEALAARQFVPCSASDWMRKGFVPPVDRSDEWTVFIGNRHLVCLKVQDKILPAAAIKEALDLKVSEVEQREKRVLGRKERKALKEAVTEELLPRALTKSKIHHAYIDFENNLLVVDSTSMSVIDTVIGSLRDALTSFPVIPLKTKSAPHVIFAHWVQNEAPKSFALSGACKLLDPLTRAKVTVANHDLTNDAFTNLLEEGHQVESIGLSEFGDASFTLCADLRVSQLKIKNGAIMAARDEDGETAADVARADFMLLHGTIVSVLSTFMTEFGGEEPYEKTQDSAGDADGHRVCASAASMPTAAQDDGDDDLYEQAVSAVREQGKPSISFVQRHLRIGYNRAARLIEKMEFEGVISPPHTDGTRLVMLHELPACL